MILVTSLFELWMSMTCMERRGEKGCFLPSLSGRGSHVGMTVDEPKLLSSSMYIRILLDKPLKSLP